MHSRIKDITGARYGRLLVVKYSHSEKRPSGGTFAYWQCLCDCGKTTIVLGSNLRRKDRKNTESCGCLHRDRIKSKDPWGVEYRKYIHHYKRSCKLQKKKVKWGLTVDQFIKLASGACYYCGQESSIKMHVGGGMRNSIDQIVSKDGYSSNNCVTSCKTCNLMKRDFSLHEFIEQARKIVHNTKRN